MSNLVRPILLTNLCCEVIYVIDQRLKAQAITKDKSSSVVNSMTSFMCGDDQLKKWFEGVVPLTLVEAKKIIDMLVNRSIMKINGTSLDKLFDLAVITFKYQIMCSTTVSMILEITQLHLQSVADIARSLSRASDISGIMNSKAFVASALSAVGDGELHRIRQGLLQVLQEYRIKANVLLQANIQNNDFSFRLPLPISSRLGSVAMYDFYEAVESKAKLPVYDAMRHAGSFYDYGVPLGSNLYTPRTLEAHTNKHTYELVPSPKDEIRHSSAVTLE